MYNAVRRSEARLVLARTMWGEARGEGAEGMRAVGHVILNRAALGGWWGDSVIAVAKAPRQFSAWNDGDPNRVRMATMMPGDNAAFDEAYRIAGDLLAGRLKDITGGATHYHADYVRPGWADGSKMVASIGAHRFYRGIG